MNQPPRLEKQSNQTFVDVINSYGFIFVPMLVIILMILIACLIHTLGGMTCVESGNWYYHIV